MTGEIVGIFYDHWVRIRQVPTSFRNPLGLWMKAVWYKANPRSSDYMRALFAEHYPGATILNVQAGPIPAAATAGVSRIVLLYPDSIGLGYSTIERSLVRNAAAVEVLNGRRRQFAFDRRARWALRCRRLLEWTMLVECLVGMLLLIASPFLLLFDFIRGKT